METDNSKKNKVIIEMNLFQKSDLPVKKQIEKKHLCLDSFCRKKLKLFRKLKLSAEFRFLNPKINNFT
jgi:hypothetical protein